MPRKGQCSNAIKSATACLKFEAYCLRKRISGNDMDISSKLDSEHCRAICDEIGVRLRMVLPCESSALPVRLQILMDRLAEQDEATVAPSIVPSMDDLTCPLDVSDDRTKLALVA